MIFWICTISYIVIGVIVGRLVYNDGIDNAYQDYLERSKEHYSRTEEQHQKWAFQRAKTEDYPIFWGVVCGIGWALFLPVILIIGAFTALISVADKLLPKSTAQKAMKAVEEKEKLDAIEAEFQKSLKIVEEYDN